MLYLLTYLLIQCIVQSSTRSLQRRFHHVLSTYNRCSKYANLNKSQPLNVVYTFRLMFVMSLVTNDAITDEAEHDGLTDTGRAADTARRTSTVTSR